MKGSKMVTNSELKVKDILERNGFNVCKGSYPDFIVWDATGKFCLLEIKRDWNDRMTEAQGLTKQALQYLGIPVWLSNAEEDKEKILDDLKRVMQRTEIFDKFFKLEESMKQMGSAITDIKRNVVPESYLPIEVLLKNLREKK